MKKFEKITAVIAVIAVGLKFLHIPGADILTILSFSALSIFYFLCTTALLNGIPFSMDLLKNNLLRNNMYGKTNEERLFGTPLMMFVARLTGWSLALTLLGILFKVLHWAGANVTLIVGAGNLCIMAIVAIIGYLKTYSRFHVGVLVRAAIIGGLGLVSYFLF